ncbi:hypothetical protein MNBD_GAMMA12-2067 [hydrothermal vent metagenome]|uniref:VOC domain-containing protein n=1 Tax=hydrothermal vent metagenome TaxID=652676 RepID=A0A3B0YA54_9ZZZZ
MKLKLLVIRCRNIEISKEFYSVLGIDFKKEKHDVGPTHYSAEFNDVVFELYPANSGEIDKTRLGLEVPGLSKLTGALNILEEYEYNSTKVKVIVDPDGRKIELYES